MSSLDDLRKKIDQTDEELVALLNRRAELVLGVKKAKEKGNIEIYSPDRERAIFERVAKLAAGGEFPRASLERIFRETISATRSLIGEISVAYIGPEHSAGFDASKKQFGDQVHHNPVSSIDDVFSKVERGDCHYGVVPLETSSGVIGTTFERFMQSDLKIIAEIELLQRLSLLGHEGGLSSVRTVYSDVHSLNESAAWMQANLPSADLIAVESASSAVLRLEKDEHSAAAVPESLVRNVDFEILASGIESQSGVLGRYIVVGKQTPEPTGRDKTTLLCSVADGAGVLCDLLKPFANHGLTLTKIESKTPDGHARDYVFFMEVVGHVEDKGLQGALKELEALCSFLRVLGSYPVASPG